MEKSSSRNEKKRLLKEKERDKWSTTIRARNGECQRQYERDASYTILNEKKEERINIHLASERSQGYVPESRALSCLRRVVFWSATQRWLYRK